MAPCPIPVASHKFSSTTKSKILSGIWLGEILANDIHLPSSPKNFLPEFSAVHNVIIQSVLNKITICSSSVALYLGGTMIVATNTLTGQFTFTLSWAHMIPTPIQACDHSYRLVNKLDLFHFQINDYQWLVNSQVPSVTSSSSCCSYMCVTGCLLPPHVSQYCIL